MAGPPDPIAEHLRLEGESLAQASPLREAVDFAGLAGLSQAQLDALPCFAARVDDDGFVQAAGGSGPFARRWPADHLGQHYFSELEPSTNNSLVRGTFEMGVAEDRLDCLLSYTFTFHGAPRHALLHLFRCSESLSNWLLVQPLEESPGA